MDSLFVRSLEEDDYQRRLVVLLAEVRRRPEAPSVVDVHRWALPYGLSQVYFVSSAAYRLRELNFKARIQEWKNRLAGWKNVEHFGMRTFERPSFYYIFEICGVGMKCRFCCLCRRLWFICTIVSYLCRDPLTIKLLFRRF